MSLVELNLCRWSQRILIHLHSGKMWLHSMRSALPPINITRLNSQVSVWQLQFHRDKLLSQICWLEWYWFCFWTVATGGTPQTEQTAAAARLSMRSFLASLWFYLEAGGWKVSFSTLILAHCMNSECTCSSQCYYAVWCSECVNSYSMFLFLAKWVTYSVMSACTLLTHWRYYCKQ